MSEKKVYRNVFYELGKTEEEEIDHHAEHSQNDNSAEELVLIQNLGASGNRGENKQRKHHL